MLLNSSRKSFTSPTQLRKNLETPSEAYLRHVKICPGHDFVCNIVLIVHKLLSSRKEWCLCRRDYGYSTQCLKTFSGFLMIGGGSYLPAVYRFVPLGTKRAGSIPDAGYRNYGGETFECKSSINRSMGKLLVLSLLVELHSGTWDIERMLFEDTILDWYNRCTNPRRATAPTHNIRGLLYTWIIHFVG